MVEVKIKNKYMILNYLMFQYRALLSMNSQNNDIQRYVGLMDPSEKLKIKDGQYQTTFESSPQEYEKTLAVLYL